MSSSTISTLLMSSALWKHFWHSVRWWWSLAKINTVKRESHKICMKECTSNHHHQFIKKHKKYNKQVLKCDIWEQCVPRVRKAEMALTTALKENAHLMTVLRIRIFRMLMESFNENYLHTDKYNIPYTGRPIEPECFIMACCVDYSKYRSTWAVNHMEGKWQRISPTDSTT